MQKKIDTDDVQESEQDLTFESQTSWKSSDKKVVSISNSNNEKGLAEGLKEGTSEIEGKYKNIDATETFTVVEP